MQPTRIILAGREGDTTPSGAFVRGVIDCLVTETCIVRCMDGIMLGLVLGVFQSWIIILSDSATSQNFRHSLVQGVQLSMVDY
jgi:hypothetical protein